jgi:hypothetical protein
LEQSFRARSLSDPDVESFFNKISSVTAPSWPPESLDLEGLTLLAIYFSPELDQSRARVAAAEAAIVTGWRAGDSGCERRRRLYRRTGIAICVQTWNRNSLRDSQ